MIVAGALDRANHPLAAPHEGRTAFVIKGGVALELRLHARARATGDLDVIADSAATNANSAIAVISFLTRSR
jgi:hypothetical protein